MYIQKSATITTSISTHSTQLRRHTKSVSNRKTMSGQSNYWSSITSICPCLHHVQLQHVNTFFLTIYPSPPPHPMCFSMSLEHKAITVECQQEANRLKALHQKGPQVFYEQFPEILGPLVSASTVSFLPWRYLWFCNSLIYRNRSITGEPSTKKPPKKSFS